MRTIKTFCMTLLILLLLPSAAKAVDYYLVGSWDGNWNSASAYRFVFTGTTGKVAIPASVLSGGTSTVSKYFSILAIESGTNQWRVNPSSTTVVTPGGGAVECSSYNNGNNASLQLNSPNTTGTYTVTMDAVSGDVNTSNVTLTYSSETGTEGGGGTPAGDYYLVGDFNGWKLSSTTYQFQPVYDQPGVYSLYVNSPLNTKGAYATGFVINPAGNTDWNKVIRPTNTGSNYVVNQTDVPTTAGYVTGGNAQWQLVANPSLRNNTQNGGSYLVTLDATNPAAPKWSVKSMPDVRVLYFLSSEDGYSFTGNYLIDTNQSPNNYNNNYTGLVTMTNGTTYKLSDGLHWFGSTADNVEYNGRASTITQKVQEGSVGGSENVPYNGETGTYALEANVLGLNEAGTIDFNGGPRKDVIIRPASSESATRVYFKGGSVTEDTNMNYDPETRTWSLPGVALANSDPTVFTEKFYNGTGTDVTVSNLQNDERGAGTYKAVYISKYESGTGEPVYKLLQSQTTTLIDGNLMRTYSDYYARVIPKGLKAYYATGYDADTHVLSMTSITDGIIPANTGVLLMCDSDASGINFDDRFNASNLKVGNVISMEKAGAAGVGPSVNYLIAEQTDISLGPVTLDSNGKVATRNYYFSYMDLDGDGSKTLGFYRCMQNNPTGNLIRKAYLALNPTIQPDASLDGIDYAAGAKAFQMEVAANTADKVSAARMVKILFDGADLLGYGVTTGVRAVGEPERVSTDNRYFNLQGMEVARPSKGIFIHKGKKIVIK